MPTERPQVAVDTKSGAATVRMPLEGAPDWTVEAVFVMDDGGPALRELKVRPTFETVYVEDPNNSFRLGPPSGLERRGAVLTSQVLGQIRLAPLYEKSREEFERLADEGVVEVASSERVRKAGGMSFVVGHDSDAVEVLRELARTHSRRPGRGGRPQSYYARWAVLYERELSKGSSSPVKDLAERFGMKRTQVRDVLYEARERGFLAGGRQGQARGKATEDAWRLYRETREGEGTI